MTNVLQPFKSSKKLDVSHANRKNTMNRILLIASLFCTSTLMAQTWEQRDGFPNGRHHPISFSLDGKGYAVTGTASNDLPTNSVFEYNPTTNTWASLADFPGTARSFGIGTVADGKAYLGFGATTTAYLNDFWRFDATDSSWTQLADCECSGRRHPAMINIGDRIYVGLGDDFSGDRNDWWMYTISADKWIRIANLPGPGRHHPFMFNAGGELFAGLGHSGQIIYRDWYKLDTVTNQWTAMSLFPGQARVAGTQFTANGYGYVLSGDGANHSYMQTGEMWQYDPAFDAWLQLPPHPGQSRWAPGSFVINNEVYFFGGLNRLTNQFPTDLWKYSLGNATASINEANNVLPTASVFPNPANNVLNWESDITATDVRVYNTVGQLVGTSSAAAKQVDVSTLTNGLYLIQFYDNTRLLKTAKVLVQH
jgi:N-acetylneuraminic acid mutarotase